VDPKSEPPTAYRLLPTDFKWLEAKTEYREIREGKHGPELRWIVNRETILNPATSQTHTRSILRHPGVCAIVPFLDGQHILLMHQFRYGPNETLWEIPAGTMAGREEASRMLPNESPAECAARELLEETGYQASRFEKVCECYATPGSSDEILHVFFARELIKRQQDLDAGEIINEVRSFSLTEIDALIDSGGIRDAKTLVGLFYALRRMKP
jgi:ADP-ribose diphosphatase